ncbi:Cys-tRNA(Pro) deacylase [Vaginisenegalia massiliensis]|uniref:Cys-tRNA(Pro) deacylase n=1 Tax=Vaginisenegalia massiliensis TaxID=2058294 RepID=UPI000F54B38F|nr:Cys-tRNA(Pro) deacylase [Vaginisenegalia massiliensis]
MAKPVKTNAMRWLDQRGIAYQAHQYEGDSRTTGLQVAQRLGENPDQVFKTLVTQGKSKQYYVFMVPVAASLNLKAAAEAVDEKAIAMIKEKDLLALTGYVHGGCSPIGMKKVFPTVLDQSALSQDQLIFSAGKIGYQIQMAREDFQKVFPIKIANLID